jgi:hypothetical protein
LFLGISRLVVEKLEKVRRAMRYADFVRQGAVEGAGVEKQWE